MKNEKNVNSVDMMGPFKMFSDLIFSRFFGDTAKLYSYLRDAREVLLSPMKTDIASTPYDVVCEEDRVKLKHYRPVTETRLKTPLLVTYAQVNRETMMDLQPGRSVVETFLNSGINLYMIDWGYPTRKDRYLTLDDHINGYIENIVNFILEKEGIPKLNLMGICQGGTFCVIYTALHPEKIKNLITTVTPTNFDTDASLLNIWARAINPDELVETYGNIPGDVMNLGFLLLNPARLMIDKYVGFLENVNNKDFVENFVRMERWIFDSPDLPAETFREFITNCYKKNLLIKNELEVDGKKVDLKKITIPVLNIYAKFDHLVPPAACELFTSKIGSEDKEDLCLETGHIGIYVSSKTQKEFGPKIIRWLMERDGNSEERKTPEKVMVKKPASKKRVKSNGKP
jgi:poly[(R)-3-hydroxyalkanoate] polymerase subunit PhaC